MNARITCVGAGYVGLVSGACFAELGHDVICVDKDAAKIAALRQGRMPIYEPGLEDLVHRNVALGRLRFSTDLAGSVKQRDAIFIGVGTPSERETGKADLSYVFAAAEEIARNLDSFCVVVTKSTVPVGTNRKVGEIVARCTPRYVSAAIASNPEFLREGAAINDFMHPDRILVGADDPRAVALLRGIYAPLINHGAPLQVTGLESAEIVKYAANAFLAVKISFINEIANLCEATGADVTSVAQGVGSDRRIGEAFLRVGPGWGGSCFPKDTRALDATAREMGVRLRTVEACIATNTERKQSMADRVAAACGGRLKGKRVAVLGLTFKGQTDDMRESPSLDVLPRLIERGAEVHAYDPAAPHAALDLLPDVVMAPTPYAAASDADVLVVMTDWREFETYDLSVLASMMADPVLVDLRNLYHGEAALAAGFRRYESLGRRPAERADAVAHAPQRALAESAAPQPVAAE